jgi:hypothetical protein
MLEAKNASIDAQCWQSVDDDNAQKSSHSPAACEMCQIAPKPPFDRWLVTPIEFDR